MIGNSQTWDNESTNTFTVSGTIGGANQLNLQGPGLFVFSGNNANFSGGVSVNNNSQLRLGNANALGSGPTTVNGTLDLFANSVSTGSLSGNGTVTNNGSGAAAINFTAASPAMGNFSGAINDGANPISLMQSGTGTIQLTGSSNYSGGTTIAAGVLVIAQDSSLGATSGAVTFTRSSTLQTSSGDVTLSSNRSVVINSGAAATLDANGSNFSINGPISGQGGVVTGTSGTLVLNGNNSYNGSTTINSGATVKLGSSTALGNTVGVTSVAAVQHSI